MSFQGTGVALVTPFKQDLSIDFDALEQVVENVLSGGVDYLVALGTTAETPTLSAEEKKQVLEFILEKNKNRKPVIVGIGGNNTTAVVDTIKAYERYDTAGILSVVPYYNKPTPQALYQHFKTIAAATEKPIILYNVPGRTATNMPAEVSLKLAADCKNIVAIKEASGILSQCMDLVHQAPEGFEVLSGDDELGLAQMALGFKGIISVAANCFPQSFSDMIRLSRQGELDAARRLHYQMLPAIRALFAEGNPTGVKAVLALKEICRGDVRAPLLPASAELNAALEKFKTIA